MASSTSALATPAAAATSAITFAGSSKYASDFQQVLTRAVGIASLPLHQMQTDQATLTSQQAALASMQTTFTAVQTALTNIGSGAQGSPIADISDPTVLQASVAPDALDGTYTFEVTDIGASTTTLSKAGLTTVTDPSVGNIDGSASYTLTINGIDKTITPTGNSLNSVAAAINAGGFGVSAIVVNIGSTASPDYRLGINSDNRAADTVGLTGGGVSLLDTLSTGSPVKYKVNGLPTEIESNSTQVTLAPGLGLNLLKAASGKPVTIQVLHDYSALQSDFAGLATAYNSAVDALAAQHGKDAGPLSGQSLLYSLQQSLRTISQYSTGSATVGSLTDFGMTLDSATGHMTFDPTAFNTQDAAATAAFLGTSTSGGFVQTATDAIASVADNVSGAIQSSTASVASQITAENTRISNEQDKITNLQASLQQQLAQSDAAIAVLEQQVTFLTSLFAAAYPSPGSSGA